MIESECEVSSLFPFNLCKPKEYETSPTITFHGHSTKVNLM